MKLKSLPILILSLVIYGCGNDADIFISKLDGLSLYWDHEVFGEGGRRLRFEFYGINEFENEYELIFHYKIENRTISIRLKETVNKGKCSYYPMPAIPPDNPFQCNPKGGFFIPESQLKPGTYMLNLVTPYFHESSELTVYKEKITFYFTI